MILRGTVALIFLVFLAVGFLVKGGTHLGRWLSGKPKPNPYGTATVPPPSQALPLEHPDATPTSSVRTEA